MSVAGQWDFSIKNGQLLKTLNTSGGNFSPREVSFMQPSLALITDKILFFESGNYKTSLGFTNIGDVDGETPSDLQDAYDKITDLIANFNLGGATPSLFDVLSVNDRPVNILEGASEAYTFQENDARKYLLQTQEFDFNIVADVLPENGMFFVKNLSGSSREILADTGVTLIGMTPIIPNNGLAIIKQIVPNVFDISVISQGAGTLQTVTDGAGNNVTTNDLIVKRDGASITVFNADETSFFQIFADGSINAGGVGAYGEGYNIMGLDGVWLYGTTDRNMELAVNTDNVLFRLHQLAIYQDLLTNFRTVQFPDKDIIVAGIDDVVIPRIKITDSQGQAFTDLASARTWIETFTSATKTNEIFYNGIYAFTVPVGSAFDSSSGFCSSDSSTENISVEDLYGFIGYLGKSAFLGNIKNNILLGDLTVGDEFFKDANPPIANRIGKLISCGAGFAQNYTGRMDVLFFGTTGGVDLPTDIFTTSNLCWIRTPLSNQYIDSGSTDGDILNALANMTDINSKVFYE